MPRAFVAIPLSPDVRAGCAAARETFVDLAPAWAKEKWVREDQLHVTLAFLGDVCDGDLASLTEALAHAAGAVPRFTLSASSLRVVPSPARAMMLWAVFDDESGSAADLAERVRAACAPCAPEADAKPFAAHATLVRARRPRPAPPDAAAAASAAFTTGSAPMSVRHATLFASRLTAAGPIHTALTELPLGTA